MAALIGEISALFGIAGFAVQLCAGLVNLKNFYDSVQNAPKELGQAVESLNQLLALIDSASRRLGPIPISAIGPELRKELRKCRQLGIDASKLVVKLNQAMQPTKGFAAFARMRAVIAKKDITVYFKRIEAAKTSLQIALQLLQIHISSRGVSAHQADTKTLTLMASNIQDKLTAMASTLQNTDAVLTSVGSTVQKIDANMAINAQNTNTTLAEVAASVQNINATVAILASNNRNTEGRLTAIELLFHAHAPPQANLSNTTAYSDQGQGKPSNVRDDEGATKRPPPRPKRYENRVHFSLPQWIYPYMFQIGWTSESRSWDYTFRIRMVVSDDCDFFRACRRGDVEKIAELLNSGQAAIQDVNPDGETILDHLLDELSTTDFYFIPRVRALETLLTHQSSVAFYEIVPDDLAWLMCFYIWKKCNHNLSTVACNSFDDVSRIWLTDALMPFEDLNLYMCRFAWLAEAAEELYSTPVFRQSIWPALSEIPLSDRIVTYIDSYVDTLAHADNVDNDYTHDPRSMLRILNIDSYDQFWAACDEHSARELALHMFRSINDSLTDWNCNTAASKFREFFAGCRWKQDVPHSHFTSSGVEQTFFLKHVRHHHGDSAPTDYHPSVEEDHAFRATRYRQGAQCFASILTSLNIDLEAYGEAETKWWADSRGWQRSGLPFHCRSRCQSEYAWHARSTEAIHTWTNFDYGPDASDWAAYRSCYEIEFSECIPILEWLQPNQVKPSPSNEGCLLQGSQELPRATIPGAWPTSDASCENRCCSDSSDGES